MPKLPTVSTKKFCAFLESRGCVCARTRGGHHVYRKKGLSRSIIVPIRAQIPIFILLNDLRTLGISKEEFIRLLKDL